MDFWIEYCELPLASKRP